MLEKKNRQAMEKYITEKQSEIAEKAKWTGISIMFIISSDINI